MDLGRMPRVEEGDGSSRFAMSVMGQEESPLSSMFFSKENMDILQRSMANAAKDATGLSLSKQSEPSLLIIMKAIYSEKALHNHDDISGQVRALNMHVLDVCVPMVISGIEGYLAYIKRISSMPVPMARGTNSSIVGTKMTASNPGL